MKLTTGAEDLGRAMAIASRIAATRDVVPAFTHVRLDATNPTSGLLVDATDAALLVRVRCPATITQDGSALLPARKFYDLVHLMPDAAVVEIDRPDGTVTAQAKIVAGAHRAKLQSIPVVDFPDLPQWPEPQVEVPRDVFLRMLKQVSPAMFTGKDPRYFLDGVRLEIEGESLTMVSTDTHRLAYVSAKIPNERAASLVVILPREAVTEIAAVFDDDADATIQIADSPSHIFFMTPMVMLGTRKLDGQYPSYQRMIPSHTDSVTVAREPLIEALKRIQVVTSSASRCVKFVFDGATVELSAASAEVGDAVERVDTSPFRCTEIHPVDQAPIVKGFSGAYVLDFLQVATAQQVRLELRGDARNVACLFRELAPEVDGDAVSGFMNVVMPMAVSDGE